jgi:protein-tyrosine phosphatase
MAAGLMYEKLVRVKANAHVRVRSAGIWALEDRPASAYAQQVMGEHDLEISSHRGRSVTQSDIDEADLILVMSQRHAEIIARDFERTENKVHLLSAMCGESYDISDPYGGSLAQYRETAAELEDLIERGCKTILRLLGLEKPAAKR